MTARFRHQRCGLVLFDRNGMSAKWNGRSVAAGLVRSAMERRVCGGWACKIDDGEKGRQLGLWDRRWRKGSVAGLVRSTMERRVCSNWACEIGNGEKGRHLGLWDRWWRECLWRKKEEMERHWGERHGEWNAERIKNKKVMWMQNKKLIFFLTLMNNAHLSIDVHCSNGAKIFRFNSTAIASFWCLRS